MNTTTPPRELWTEPTPQPPSLDQRRQAIELVYGVGAHTAHITAWRLEQAQTQGVNNPRKQPGITR